MAFTPFPLPNGRTLRNRIIKAALEENMIDALNHNQPSPQMLNLYSAWGKGGAGLILSGHIMIDPRAMANAGDTLLSSDTPNFDEDLWRKWVKGTQQEGAQFWFQINHPGRQMKRQAGMQTYGPSAVPLRMGVLSTFFDKPLAMTEDQIQEIIGRFIWTAKKAEQLGADGVEIHAAHGYLLSQFLSPLSNIRTDRWGGSKENRARLLFEVVRGIRAAVSPAFGVSVKINSADFQRGGFETNDLLWIVEQLNTMKLDFIELSGGSYESQAMLAGDSSARGGKPQASSTALRELYFFEAAKQVENVASMPVVVTGGIRSKATLDAVVASSDRLLAGVGTALGLVPDLVKRWERGEDPAPSTSESWVLPKAVKGVAHTAAVHWNMRAAGGSGWSWYGVWPTLALVVDFVIEERMKMQYQRWFRGLEESEKCDGDGLYQLTKA